MGVNFLLDAYDKPWDSCRPSSSPGPQGLRLFHSQFSEIFLSRIWLWYKTEISSKSRQFYHRVTPPSDRWLQPWKIISCDQNDKARGHIRPPGYRGVFRRLFSYRRSLSRVQLRHLEFDSAAWTQHIQHGKENLFGKYEYLRKIIVNFLLIYFAEVGVTSA